MLFAPSVRAQSTNPLSVTCVALLSQQSTLFGHLDHHVRVLVNGTMSASESTTVMISFPFTLLGLSASPSDSNGTISSQRAQNGVMTVVNETIPAGKGAFFIDIEGVDHGDSSVLFQDTAVIAPVTVTDSQPPFNPTSDVVLVPVIPGMQVQSVKTEGASALILSAGIPYITMNASPAGGGARVVYSTNPGLIVLIAGLTGAMALALAWPYLVKDRMRDFKESATRRLSRVMKRRSPKPLLSVFVLVSLLMILVPFVGGQSPTPKVFLAATPATAKTIGPYIEQAGFSYVTPADITPAQFDSMSWLGSFYAVVVADYPPPINTGLGSATNIILMTDYLPSAYVTNARLSYQYVTIPVASPQGLPSALGNIPITVGLDAVRIGVPSNITKALISLEGILSLILPFLAMATLCGYLLESGRRGIGGLFRAGAYTIMIFVTVQVIFDSASVLMHVPVQLYGSFTPSLTAVGSLAPLSSGTGVFVIAGTLGGLFGVTYTEGLSLKAERYGFLLTAALGLVYLLWVKEGVDSSLFVTSVMAGLGSGVSELYSASFGTTLFFLSITPLVLFPKLARTTSTILLAFCIAGGGAAFLSVTELSNDYATVAAVIPGLALAVIIGAVFLGAGTAEAVIRKQQLPFPVPKLFSRLKPKGLGKTKNLAE